MVADEFGNQFIQGWRDSSGILVVNLCPRAPPLRERLLQRRCGASEIRIVGERGISQNFLRSRKIYLEEA